MLFTGWLRGQPPLTKLSKIFQFVVFPGTMAASLIICPPESSQDKNKSSSSNSAAAKASQ